MQWRSIKVDDIASVNKMQKMWPERVRTKKSNSFDYFLHMLTGWTLNYFNLYKLKISTIYFKLFSGSEFLFRSVSPSPGNIPQNKGKKVKIKLNM